MKPHPLRTCIFRGARTTRAATELSWRPLSLCWPRNARRAAPGVARTRGKVIHQHLPSTLHLHLHLAMPAARAARLVSAAMRCTFATTLVHLAGTPASSTRQLALYRELTLHSQQRRHSSSLSIRHEPVSVLAAPLAAAAQPRRVFVTTSAHDAAVAPRLTPASPSTGPTPARRPVMLTTARSRRARGQSQSAARTSVSPTVHSPALVWQQPTPAAISPVDTEADGASVSAPAGKSASTPATVHSVSTRTTAAPQQLREALRMNLLDGAFTERLTDDVIRRVEKRMRIERERRGL